MLDSIEFTPTIDDIGREVIYVPRLLRGTVVSIQGSKARVEINSKILVVDRESLQLTFNAIAKRKVEQMAPPEKPVKNSAKNSAKDSTSTG